MHRLCPLFPLTPIPSRWHLHPRSRRKSLGNSRTIIQDLAPCHRLVVSQCPQPWAHREAVGRGSRWGWGLWGATGMSPLGVCAAPGVGALSPCPQGCHLPRCLAAVFLLGLGLSVPPGAPPVDQDSGADMSHKAWTVQHSPGVAQGRCKDPAACLAFPRKVKISS